MSLVSVWSPLSVVRCPSFFVCMDSRINRWNEKKYLFECSNVRIILANFCIQFKLWVEVVSLKKKIFVRTLEPLKCIANHWCITGYSKLSFSFGAIYYSFFYLLLSKTLKATWKRCGFKSFHARSHSKLNLFVICICGVRLNQFIVFEWETRDEQKRGKENFSDRT